MKRIAVIIGAIVIFILPLALVLYQKWESIRQTFFKSTFVFRKSVSSQFGAETKMPGYNIALINTVFLEYIAATMHLYDVNAIADPEMYFGNRAMTKRHTVSHLRIELVPTLDRYMVGLGGSVDFAVRGIYVIEKDTLVVRVSLDEAELNKTNPSGKFVPEDTFLDIALQTLVYATAKPGATLDFVALGALKKAIDENIKTGVFPRPRSRRRCWGTR